MKTAEDMLKLSNANRPLRIKELVDSILFLVRNTAISGITNTTFDSSKISNGHLINDAIHQLEELGYKVRHMNAGRGYYVISWKDV